MEQSGETVSFEIPDSNLDEFTLAGVCGRPIPDGSAYGEPVLHMCADSLFKSLHHHLFSPDRFGDCQLLTPRLIPRALQRPIFRAIYMLEKNCRQGSKAAIKGVGTSNWDQKMCRGLRVIIFVQEI